MNRAGSAWMYPRQRGRPGENAWSIDLTVADGDNRVWIYRRDPRLQVPWNLAVLRSESGMPYLAPELQLLFKSHNRRPKDDVDAAAVIPQLDDRQLEFLRARLGPQHAWITGSAP